MAVIYRKDNPETTDKQLESLFDVKAESVRTRERADRLKRPSELCETSEVPENIQQMMPAEVIPAISSDLISKQQEMMDSLEEPDLLDDPIDTCPDLESVSSSRCSPNPMEPTLTGCPSNAARVMTKDLVLAPDSQTEVFRSSFIDEDETLAVPVKSAPPVNSTRKLVPLPALVDSTSVAAPFNVTAEVSEDDVVRVNWEHIGGGKDKTYNIYLQKRYGETSWTKLNDGPVEEKFYRHFNRVKSEVEYSVFVSAWCGDRESETTESNFCGNFIEEN